MGFRFSVILAVFTLLYAGLALNFYNLQIKKGSYYSARAESQHRLAGELEPERGNIFFTDKDKKAVPVAIKKYYPFVFAVPKEINDAESVSFKIAPILGLNEAELFGKLSLKNSAYQSLKKRIFEETADKIRELSLKGIYVGREPCRFYPNGKLAAHILGYVDTEKIGRYGAESFYDKILNGEKGKVSGDKIIEPVNGKDIYLTIDFNIQFASEKILEKLVGTYKAEGGTAIVMNPKNGDILAMASLPNFDPNDYGKYDIKDFLNPAVEAVYEPGSIFKMITMAAGIDSGRITPETEFVDTGEVILNNRVIKNSDHKVYGRVTMTNVIEKSINTGAVFAVREIGREIFLNYLKKFGLNKKTGVDLPGEVTGSIRALEEDGRDINFATASFGQGVSITPVRLIAAISAVANKGLMVKPHLIVGKPGDLGRPINEETSRKAVAMMVSAVDKAEVAKISDYSVAGKTGTAQVPNAKGGGYGTDVINTYVGFAPAYDPRFIVLLKMDKPAGAPLAGQTIVPAFRELSQFILNYYAAPPDRVE